MQAVAQQSAAFVAQASSSSKTASRAGTKEGRRDPPRGAIPPPHVPAPTGRAALMPATILAIGSGTPR